MNRGFPGLRLLLVLTFAAGAWLLLTTAAVAQEPQKESQSGQAEQPEEAAGIGKEPFAILGVGAESHIDPTRKSAFEDYSLNMERYCTGCWCNSVFGDNLSESFNELVGKSEKAAELWQSVSACIDPDRNTIAQIRTIPLQPRFDDIEFAKIVFHFSEFLDTPLATTAQVRSPEEFLKTLGERYGSPENIEDTWYLWHRPEALMILDLFNVRRHQWELAELLVVYTGTLEAHLEKVRQIEEKER